MAEKIFTDKAPAAIGPYSQAIKAGNTVYTSGQIALSPESGALVGDNVKDQTEQVMQNLSAVLTAAGASLDSIVKTTCFIADMADFAAFNEVYGKYITSAPARSCIAAKALPKGALVEVEAVAVIDAE
ncbi:MAG: RidA family protein [Clostridia bacterium]|nr:RidA family protein [Clostridia bacterium]